MCCIYILYNSCLSYLLNLCITESIYVEAVVHQQLLLIILEAYICYSITMSIYFDTMHNSSKLILAPLHEIHQY